MHQLKKIGCIEDNLRENCHNSIPGAAEMDLFVGQLSISIVCNVGKVQRYAHAFDAFKILNRI